VYRVAVLAVVIGVVRYQRGGGGHIQRVDGEKLAGDDFTVQGGDVILVAVGSHERQVQLIILVLGLIAQVQRAQQILAQVQQLHIAAGVGQAAVHYQHLQPLLAIAQQQRRVGFGVVFAVQEAQLDPLGIGLDHIVQADRRALGLAQRGQGQQQKQQAAEPETLHIHASY